MQYDEKCDTVYEDKCSTQYITVNEQVRSAKADHYQVWIRNWNSKVFLTWQVPTVQHLKNHFRFATQCMTLSVRQSRMKNVRSVMRINVSRNMRWVPSSHHTTIQYIIMDPNTLLILIIIWPSVILVSGLDSRGWPGYFCPSQGTWTSNRNW